MAARRAFDVMPMGAIRPAWIAAWVAAGEGELDASSDILTWWGVDSTTDGIIVGRNGDASFNAVIRFGSCSLVPGQNVVSAAIRLKVADDPGNGDTVRFLVKGILEPNPEPVTGFFDAFGRPRTTAMRSFQIAPGTFLAGADYPMGGLDDIVQEIVNQSGYEFGNAIMFYITNYDSDSHGWREFEPSPTIDFT